MKSQTEGKWSFVFSILLKKHEDLWVAHCLELDLVVAAPTREEAESDILSIIDEQVRYCITNNNMENLFRDAPKEVWDEFSVGRPVAADGSAGPLRPDWDCGFTKYLAQGIAETDYVRDDV